MKIGLDLRMLGGGSGISRYISELSHEILKQDKNNEYVLFFNVLTKELHDAYSIYGHDLVETKIGHYSYAEQIWLPRLLRQKHLDLVHFPHFNVPLLYRKPFVVTIHDLTHTLMPGRRKSRWYKRFAYGLVILNAVKTAKGIIAVSESTKKELVTHFGIEPDKISVVYEAVNQNFRMMDKEEAFQHVSNRFGITKPYILYVGVWRRYKNVDTLALAFDKLRDKGQDYELVLAGEPDPFYPEMEERVRGIRHAAHLKVLGRVDEAELPYLYNAAKLFVLPSLAEGFGLTALEAAACGVPIACSDIPTLREVMGQGAVYFDPKNVDNMADVLSEILNNETMAEDYANRALSRVRNFSWSKAALDTLKIYKQAL